MSELPECMGDGWRPVLELATGCGSHGPFRTAAHALTALSTLEAEGIGGSAITWKFMPLISRYEIVWAPAV